MNSKIPKLLEGDYETYFELATSSIRKRYPKILHNKGAYLNEVFNFVPKDSYMHPHLHPGKEKVEKMYLIKGSFALILFDESGQISKKIILEEGKLDFVEVPAFTWHTYVMLTERVVIYETMEGIYNPETWKKLASWAPKESSDESEAYLKSIKNTLK